MLHEQPLRRGCFCILHPYRVLRAAGKNSKGYDCRARQSSEITEQGRGGSFIRPRKDRRGEEGTAVVPGTFYEKRLTNGPSKKTICPFTWPAAVICLCPGQSQKEKDP